MNTEGRVIGGIFILFFIGFFYFGGCAGNVSRDWEGVLSGCPTSAELGRFSAWDRLEIRVLGESDLSGEYEVSPKGTLSFPMLGEVKVEGLRCDEIEELLTSRLRESYLRDPSVVCINKEVSRTAVTVDGQVKTPGIIAFRPGLMLSDVIAQSGGLTVRSQGNRVVVTRKFKDGATRAVVVPYEDIVSSKANNVCLHPGDLIYIPESAF